MVAKWIWLLFVFYFRLDAMDRNILVVDDEEEILSSMKRLLADTGMKVLTANNAEAALLVLESNPVSVLITDNRMTGMSGLELLSIVKNIYPDTVRILMTGYVDVKTAISAINEGEVYKFIEKPWDGEGLSRILQEAVERFELVESLQEVDDDPMLLSLAQTVELKDANTRGHCDRVAAYAMIMADTLNLSAEMKKYIKFGCWLHDCGKIGVPEAILNKNGPLDNMEMDTLKRHSFWGADVAEQAQLHQVVVNIILYHHERYDGLGYPSGIKGKVIPLEARIATIADVFDALTTDRPYREKFSKEKAIGILREDSGKAFDPELIDMFLENLDEAMLVTDDVGQ